VVFLGGGYKTKFYDHLGYEMRVLMMVLDATFPLWCLWLLAELGFELFPASVKRLENLEKKKKYTERRKTQEHQ